MVNSTQMEAQPDGELQFWRSITRRLPHLRGAGRICGVVERIYNRKKRPDTTAEVFDFKMVLDPADNVERQFLFCPHLYDSKETTYLRQNLKAGDTFLDCGANVGFYSLIASGIVGDKGAVLSVEADPYNASRLKANVDVNGMKNVRVINFGLSDKTETLRLGRDTSGNRGGNSFLSNSPEGVTVPCHTLMDVLLAEGVKQVDGAKMDIEGFEFKVLQKFFSDGHSEVWPKFWIIEINPSFDKKLNGNTLELLKQNGYSLTKASELNYFAVRK